MLPARIDATAAIRNDKMTDGPATSEQPVQRLHKYQHQE